MKNLGPDHWENLYLEGRLPWDAGGVPAEFLDYLARSTGPGSALVPGCGSGYEIVSLAEAGFDVVAVDFSPAAIDIARRIAGQTGATIDIADFFELPEESFDLIYERAFMCALDPGQRDAWADKVRSLLKPAGCLVGYFFLDGAELDGPPFGMWPDELQQLLGDEFTLTDERRTSDPKPVFKNQEYWQVWCRSGVTAV